MTKENDIENVAEQAVKAMKEAGVEKFIGVMSDGKGLNLQAFGMSRFEMIGAVEYLRNDLREDSKSDE